MHHNYMRYLKILGLLSFATTLIAQAIFPIDWRYSLSWTNPNAPGTVQFWTVYATNTTATHQTSVSGASTSVDLAPLLNGSPAGVYTLYTTATSVLGGESDPGELLLVNWPGGNGKPLGGRGLGVRK